MRMNVAHANPTARALLFRTLALALGPLVATAMVVMLDLAPGRPAVTRTAAVAVWMALWWITEAVPLAVTALLPMVLFPVHGIISGKATASLYVNHIIFLFIGGFIVALAMQRWNLHRRIALRILLWFGVRPRRLLAGFMAATAFLSMWISNTATTMMMVPIALAIVLQLENDLGRDKVRRFSIGVFLAIAYSASLGGIATLVGTPPNLSFVRILEISFAKAPDIAFTSWLLFALPISVVCLVITWALLSLLFCPRQRALAIDEGTFREQVDALGPMSFEERVVLADFVLLALLWLSRSDLELGGLTVPGWSGLFGKPAYLNDGVVAVAMALVLFMIPSRREPGKRIMDWETAAKLPWGIVLLFGGGFALASGFKESGLSMWIGGRLEGLQTLDPVLIIAAVCLVMTFLTELTSNTATAEMALPVLAGLAVAVKLNPLALMIPATLACSCAFMLPVATPPNAIVFGTQRLRIADMARAGLVLNLIGVVAITVALVVLGRAVFGIDLTAMPDWATSG